MATPLLICMAPCRTGGPGLNPHLEGTCLAWPGSLPCTLQPRSHFLSLLLISLCWHQRHFLKRLFKVNAWGSPSSYHGVQQHFYGNFFSRSVHVKGSFKLYLTALHVHSPPFQTLPFLPSQPLEGPFPQVCLPGLSLPGSPPLSSLSRPLPVLCSSQVFFHPFILTNWTP